MLRFAPLITSLQIAQFVWGTLINLFAAAAYLAPSVGCAIRPQILQIGAIMYLLYGGLFMQLFWRRYLGPKRRRGAAAKDEAAAPSCRVPAEGGLGRTAAASDAELLKVV